jgi:hypothetical protein
MFLALPSWENKQPFLFFYQLLLSISILKYENSAVASAKKSLAIPRCFFILFWGRLHLSFKTSDTISVAEWDTTQKKWQALKWENLNLINHFGNN